MTKTQQLTDVILSAFRREVLKKLIFSRARTGEVSKISARLVAHRGRKMLVLEYSLPGNTVSHRNLAEKDIEGTLAELYDIFSQVNLITTVGECEWKISKSGKEALLGADKLAAKLSGDSKSFEAAIEALDHKKNYILSGDEEFLKQLGISDKSGRVHDKKQGKFRQINRFLEIIEDTYEALPKNDIITVYDLCCGKSYLSFAVYYYLTVKKERSVELLGIDLKQDCIKWCASLADTLGFDGMKFVCDDIRNTPEGAVPDMVISLHACDIATDIVLARATELGAPVILSTPCCHRHINGLVTQGELEFVTRHPHLSNKLCEAVTDALRVSRLEALGYAVTVIELVDPDDTPKNTLIKAIRRSYPASVLADKAAKYEAEKKYIFGDRLSEYLKNI